MKWVLYLISCVRISLLFSLTVHALRVHSLYLFRVWSFLLVLFERCSCGAPWLEVCFPTKLRPLQSSVAVWNYGACGFGCRITRLVMEKDFQGNEEKCSLSKYKKIQKWALHKITHTLSIHTVFACTPCSNTHRRSPKMKGKDREAGEGQRTGEWFSPRCLQNAPPQTKRKLSHKESYFLWKYLGNTTTATLPSHIYTHSHTGTYVYTHRSAQLELSLNEHEGVWRLYGNDNV